jgi:hypothetical protein
MRMGASKLLLEGLDEGLVLRVVTIESYHCSSVTGSSEVGGTNLADKRTWLRPYASGVDPAGGTEPSGVRLSGRGPASGMSAGGLSGGEGTQSDAFNGSGVMRSVGENASTGGARGGGGGGMPVGGSGGISMATLVVAVVG